MDYKIISDGCCDLEKEIIEQYNLRIIPFYISFDEETYYKEIEEIGIREVSFSIPSEQWSEWKNT